MWFLASLSFVVRCSWFVVRRLLFECVFAICVWLLPLGPWFLDFERWLFVTGYLLTSFGGVVLGCCLLCLGLSFLVVGCRFGGH